MKNIILSSITATFLVIGLTACGGGSSSSSTKSKTDEISKRQQIMIFYHYPKDVCNSSYLKDGLKRKGATDIITSVVNRDVTCSSYGKTNGECISMDTGAYGEPTCVIGANRINNNGYISKLTDNTLILENMQEVSIEAF